MLMVFEKSLKNLQLKNRAITIKNDVHDLTTTDSTSAVDDQVTTNVIDVVISDTNSGLDMFWSFVLISICFVCIAVFITIYIIVIGRSGGGGRAGHMPPLWDPILSFSHTFSLKSVHVGGPCPPLMSAHPPTGNPGSATDCINQMFLISTNRYTGSYFTRIIDQLEKLNKLLFTHNRSKCLNLGFEKFIKRYTGVTRKDFDCLKLQICKSITQGFANRFFQEN